jgi:hypothetical protein
MPLTQVKTSNLDTTNSLLFRNRIINGDMRIDQRNAGGSVTAVNGAYNVDRWIASSATTSVFSIQQSTTAPAGFSNSLLVTSLASTSITTNLFYSVQQIIEGYNVADFGFGTASAKTVTLSFWVRSSLTGTFSGCVQNGNVDRSYPFTYTISSAGTWEQKSVTILGDTSGTWGTTNGAGMFVLFSLGIGSARQGTVNTWNSSNARAVAGETVLVGTTGATWQVTGVQFEGGAAATAFERRPFGTELQLCQRYFYKHQNTNGGNSYPLMLQCYSSSAAFGKICDLPVTMRATPTSSTTATSGTFTPSAANGTGAGAFTGTTIETSTVNSLCTGAWTGSSGLVAGNATVVTMPNNAFFSASAEL